MGNTGTKKSRTGIPLFRVAVHRYEIYRYGPAKVFYHSPLGHVRKLALKIKEGAEAAGAEVDVFQVVAGPNPEKVFADEDVPWLQILK